MFPDYSQSQGLPGAQPTPKTGPRGLEAALEEFNAGLIVENNNRDEDSGVFELLEALRGLDDATKTKNIKSRKLVKKPQLVAGLGFLHGMGYDESRELFKGVLVDDLTQRIIKKYNQIVKVSIKCLASPKLNP